MVGSEFCLHVLDAGIGLSICKKIVECHRGTIAAHSTPGQGTSVVMILPVRQPQ